MWMRLQTYRGFAELLFQQVRCAGLEEEPALEIQARG
jgi:hypothetical protein